MGFDVFNALDLMENKEFLEPLKFGIGDGNLQYYLYNWRCPSMPPNMVSTLIFVVLDIICLNRSRNLARNRNGLSVMLYLLYILA